MAIALSVARLATSALGTLDNVIDVNTSGILDSDYILAQWMTRRTLVSGASGFAEPWGPVAQDGVNNSYWTKRQSGSPPATYDWTQGEDEDGGIVLLSSWSGVDTTTPYEGFTQTAVTGSGTQTAPAVTPSVDNCIRVIIWTDAEDQVAITTPPSGFTILNSLANNHFMSLAGYWKALGAGTAGVAQPTVNLVWADGGAIGYVTQLLLRPAAASAPGVVTNPAIIGTPQVGVASSFTPGTYSGSPTPTQSGIQWTLDGSNISGATSSTYTPVTGDATHTLAVKETVTNTSGSVTGTSTGKTVSAAAPSYNVDDDQIVGT